MDFGLSRIVEMFEERFGPRATSVLVALVALALGAISLKTIVDDLIVPLYTVASQLLAGQKLSDLRHLLPYRGG